MISKLWSGKSVALAVALVTFACLVALLSWSLTSPEPVSSASLGPEWQCSRVALVLTTCTRVGQAESGAIQVRAKEIARPGSRG